MGAEKSDILASLRAQIAQLQGFTPIAQSQHESFGLGPLESCFPNATFPTGTIHEFLAGTNEDTAASEGFIAGLLAKLMENGIPCLWISRNRKLFPPSLQAFGTDPQQIIFIDLYQSKQILWVTEEALKCEGLACVIAELPDLNFAQSRRLQLATEKSRVTGFILRKQPKYSLSATACTARWQIKPQPTLTIDGIPGVGHPRWEVNLLKVKNGEGGKFLIQWTGNKFASVENPTTTVEPQKIIPPERGLIA